MVVKCYHWCVTLHFAGKIPAMRWTAVCLSLTGFLLSLQGILSTYCSVTEYSSSVSYYTKFIEQTSQNYNYWASVCDGKLINRDLHLLRFAHTKLLRQAQPTQPTPSGSVRVSGKPQRCNLMLGLMLGNGSGTHFQGSP